MARIADIYASALLQSALEHDDLELVYRQAAGFLGKPVLLRDGMAHYEPEEEQRLVDFLAYLKRKGRSEYTEAILEAFMELSWRHLGIIAVEVITAVPLTAEQLETLHIKLVQRSKKQVQLLPRTDASLIAGMRLVADGVVYDTSVKQQLAEMKEKIYRGVYFSG